MRVVIVGGGIGGIATAIALTKAGLDPVVLEQASAIAPVGAGINLAANAMKALTALGADEHVRRTGVRGEQEVYLDLQSGEKIARRQLLGPAAAERYGDTYISVHRADLMDALIAELEPGVLRVGARVAWVDQSERGITVHLESGEQVDGDLLVGADGLKSLVRAQVFGHDEPIFMGVQGWRALFPRASLPAHLPPSEGLGGWIGMGLTVSMYPIRAELMYCGAFVPAQEVREESWTSEGGIDELRTAFRGACDDVQSTVDAIESSAQSLFLTSLYYRDPLATWSRGRMVLLGDAAHPGPPGAGQGAAMAMEDAVTLAGCLRRHGSDWKAAFVEYERRRVPRAQRVVMAALAIQRFAGMSDPVQIAARNGRLQGLAQLDPLGETSFGWMAGHDASAALELSVEEAIRPAGQLTDSLRRPEAQRAFELWRDALTADDRSAGWLGERAGFERAVASFATGDVHVAAEAVEVDAGGVPALLVGGGDGPALLHLHGGGFTMGSARSSLDLAHRLARAVGGPVLVPDYRLAPEHAFPAALDDAVSVYRWWRGELGAGRAIGLTGESAGGGLAVSLAVRLRDEGDVPPTAIAVVSPFADLTLQAASIDSAIDGWFGRDALTLAAASYLHSTSPTDPGASPVHADLPGMPALLVLVAESEALRDDAAALVTAARAVGVEAELVLVRDTVHSFVLFDFLPESRDALERIAGFITSRSPSCDVKSSP